MSDERDKQSERWRELAELLGIPGDEAPPARLADETAVAGHDSPAAGHQLGPSGRHHAAVRGMVHGHVEVFGFEGLPALGVWLSVLPVK